MLQALPDAGDVDAAAAPELLGDPEAEFRIGEAASSRVDSVSTQSPVDDFKALIQQGQMSDAVEGLQKAVYTLVDTSLGDRYCNHPPPCLLCKAAFESGLDSLDVLHGTISCLQIDTSCCLRVHAVDSQQCDSTGECVPSTHEASHNLYAKQILMHM